MKKLGLISIFSSLLSAPLLAQSFTPGNLVVLQTSGTLSKASSAIILKEFNTSGVAGITLTLPNSGTNPIQTSGVYGGSEGFLTTATDGKYLLLTGYQTSATISDITATSASAVPRVIGTVAPSGFYLQVASSTTFYNANDIRGAVSDGTNYWASGASVASVDGIDYFGPATPTALATAAIPPKAYGIRIFNGQLYYSTQKAGPTNTATQLGVFTLGTGLPTSGTPSPSQVINTAALVPQDFSFNSTGDVCYVAISLNTAAGGIQKWTRSGAVWTLAYTIGTGATNIGAYGLVVDYSGTNPVLYASTFETTGNRVVKIVDNGTAASASITTIVPAVTNVFNKGIAFAPVASGLPVVNLSISADTASEAAASVITIKANASYPLPTAQTIALRVSGLGITSGDYNLSSSTITIPAGASSATATFTVKDDILGEGTEWAKITMSTSSSAIVLGIDTIKTIAIADNDGNNIPTISMYTSTTTNYIDGAASVSPSSPFVLSAVVGDTTDPGAHEGMDFIINDLETPDTSLIVSYTSSNASVASLSNIHLTGKDSIRHLQIVPLAVGYSDIKITVSDGIDSAFYLIKYAASADSLKTSKTFWHTGMSDASDAIALDDDYYITGDDELNVLNVYSRKHSGLPLVSYNYSSFLALPDPGKPEADLEAATPSWKNLGRVYWMGSMSNGKAPFDAKPNRDRIFATKISGTGAATTFSFVGFAALKSSLLAWGDAYGYNFTASAAAGVDSKLPNGFAAEGLVFGPDSTTLYVGMRAPLVPSSTRKNAVIVPIKNFETWFNNGAAVGTPSFGLPIELNLSGRGIRDMIRLSNGTYIIVAGNPGSTPITSAIYKWTGYPKDTPIMIACPFSDTLNMEGVMQVNMTATATRSLQVITDNGDDIFYNDATEAKDFGDLMLRKFKSIVFDSLDVNLKPNSLQQQAISSNGICVYPNPSQGQVALRILAETADSIALSINNLNGQLLFSDSRHVAAGTNLLALDLRHLPKGIYMLRIQGASINGYAKLLLQ